MPIFQVRIFYTSDDLKFDAAASALARHIDKPPEVAAGAIRDVLDGALRIFEFPDETAAHTCAREISALGLITKVTEKR